MSGKINKKQNKKSFDVYFFEVFEEEARLIRKHLKGKIKFGLTNRTIQESGYRNPPSSLISVRTQSIIPAHWQDKLDGVLSRTTGYDNLLNFKNSIHKNVICGYLDEYATRSVAEHAVMIMFSLMRHLPRQLYQMKSFNRDGITGKECKGKNLLVVGVGRIGSEIAGIAKGLGMNVKGVDIVKRYEFISYTEKYEGIRWADVIICAMDLNESNYHYFNYDLLKKAKKGAIFINIARGEHSPLKDMLKLLKERRLGGIGLDVFEDEPVVSTALRNPAQKNFENVRIINELLNYPNVILTPHNAFNTIESLNRKVRLSINEILFFLKDHDFHNKI